MILRLIARVTAVVLLACLAGGAAPVAAQQPVELSFYYPVAVGGPVTKIIDGLAADFQKENPDICGGSPLLSAVSTFTMVSW